MGMGLASRLGRGYFGAGGNPRNRRGQRKPGSVVGVVDVVDLVAGHVCTDETVIAVTQRISGDGVEFTLLSGLPIAHIAGLSRFAGRVAAYRVAVAGRKRVRGCRPYASADYYRQRLALGVRDSDSVE